MTQPPRPSSPIRTPAVGATALLLLDRGMTESAIRDGRGEMESNPRAASERRTTQHYIGALGVEGRVFSAHHVCVAVKWVRSTADPTLRLAPLACWTTTSK